MGKWVRVGGADTDLRSLAYPSDIAGRIQETLTEAAHVAGKRGTHGWLKGETFHCTPFCAFCLHENIMCLKN